MSGDLVSGRYPLGYTPAKMRGSAVNANQANLGARTNLDWFGLGGVTDAAAALISGELTAVAVPVEHGDVYRYVDVLVGATAAVTPTHSFAVLFNQAGVIVGTQSVDGTNAAIAASGRFTFTLGAAYMANAVDSPNGWLTAAFSVTAGTVPSLISASVPAAAQYAWFAGVPKFAGAGGSALGGAAPATLPTLTAQAAAPVVFLR